MNVKMFSFLEPIALVLYVFLFTGYSGRLLACTLFVSQSWGKSLFCCGGADNTKDQSRYMPLQRDSAGNWDVEWVVLPSYLPYPINW